MEKQLLNQQKLRARDRVQPPGGVVSYPDPALCEGKGLVTIERFLGSC